jgi:hypothetical protein
LEYKKVKKWLSEKTKESPRKVREARRKLPTR